MASIISMGNGSLVFANPASKSERENGTIRRRYFDAWAAFKILFASLLKLMSVQSHKLATWNLLMIIRLNPSLSSILSPFLSYFLSVCLSLSLLSSLPPFLPPFLSPSLSLPPSFPLSLHSHSDNKGETWSKSWVVTTGPYTYSCLTHVASPQQVGLLWETGADNCYGPSCQLVFSKLTVL